MCRDITIVYNEPGLSRYDRSGEGAAVAGVLEAVEAVEKAVTRLAYSTCLLGLALPLDEAVSRLESARADIFFNLFEGFSGQPDTETFVPEYLAARNLIYTGCPAAALKLALHKAQAKDRLRECGIPTPDYQVLSNDNLYTFKLKFPCIVKPLGEDASHGITTSSVVHNALELSRQLARVSTGYNGDVLVEEFVTGREFNATVLDDGVLPISEIIYTLPANMPWLLTYDAKWQPRSCYYRNTNAMCPAAISQAERRKAAGMAMAAYKAIGCQGYARVDMRQDERGVLNVIEVNPNPDISPVAGTTRQAEAAGMSYQDFIQKIILAGFKRGGS